MIEQFTPAHLHMLAVLNDPPRFFTTHGLDQPAYMAAGIATLIELIPEFTGQREWYDLLVSDLSSNSLLARGIHGTMSGESIWQPSTTQLAKRFVRFISD
jgi:hypothetical protein